MRSIVLFAALLAIGNSCCDGAVLVRFINTVPTRTAAGVANIVNGRPNGNAKVDRVGLQYSSAGQAPALVWTEALNPRASEATTAPYSYTHAMPALQQYHRTSNGDNGVLVDTVANYKASDLPSFCNAAAVNAYAASCDNYEQTYLKQDGVGLYLQFAAGTYTFQAYAALTTGVDTTDFASPARPITTSSRSMTFEDGRVYSIIASGAGAFAATPALTGNTVTLTMIEESTAPTTFGKAALRWFHAIKAQAANSITVYPSSTNNNAIASSVAFNAVSSYVDVNPGTTLSFPIVASGASNTVITSSTNAATHDIRAGLRATIICAQNDEATATIFCRLIPSRVVAYVRLVNDLAGQTSQVQGPFGGQALNLVKLTLWASHEIPRPSILVEGSQEVGSNAVPRIAPLSRGLYGVVSGVAAGVVSGYGEVFVPLLIMDYAVRFIVIRDGPDAVQYNNNAATTAYDVNSLYTAATNNLVAPVTPTTATTGLQWFWAAPIHKRVNFVVKTDGFATLTGRSTGATSSPRDDTNNRWFNNALLVDTYLEPGTYSTLIVTSVYNGATLPYVPSTIQTANSVNVKFYFRLDRDIDGVSSSSALVANNKANVNWIPVGPQELGGTINLRKKGTSAVTLTPTVGAANTFSVAVTSPQTAWNTPTVAVSTDAGDYTFDHSPTVNTNACLNKIPGSTDLTVAVGDVVDVFLLNSFGCAIDTTAGNANLLKVVAAKTQSALDTNHAVNTLLDGTVPSTPGGFLASSASASSSSVAFLFAAVVAIVAALL